MTNKIKKITTLEIARRAAGLTLGELAELAGTTATHLSKIENMKLTPQRKTMLAITTALSMKGISLAVDDLNVSTGIKHFLPQNANLV